MAECQRFKAREGGVKYIQSMASPVSGRRARLALWLALAVDILQWALIPLFAEGFLSWLNDAVDVATAGAMTSLLGWHLVFLPSFIGELVPLANLAPTWTAAVLWVTRRSRQEDELPSDGEVRPTDRDMAIFTRPPFAKRGGETKQ